MNSLDNSQRPQDSLERGWQEIMRRPQQQLVNGSSTITPQPLIPSRPFIRKPNYNNGFPAKLLDEDDVNVSKVVPAVTVVLEGRSICQRISLHKQDSYQSLAMALRQMFVDVVDGGDRDNDNDLDLSNAVPGHIIAYEDMENDLLLAGDLSWKDFVRVAKRIRILPVKPKSSRGRPVLEINLIWAKIILGVVKFNFRVHKNVVVQRAQILETCSRIVLENI